MSAIVDLVLILIIVLTMVLNGSVIGALARQWKDLNAHDAIILSLSICDFCQVITAFPLELNHNVQKNKIECMAIGFSALSLALGSISLITAMSIGRMIAIAYPLKCFGFMKKKENSLYFIIPSLVYGFSWASFPLMGWSNYEPELESNQRCSINLSDDGVGPVTYLYSLLVFCYFIPIITMVISFVKIKKQFKKLITFERSRNQTVVSKEASSADRRYTILVLVMMMAFLFAWTPYAIVVFIVSINRKVSSVWADSAALLGKSATFYNPIIYALLYRKYRLSVAELIRCGKTAAQEQRNPLGDNIIEKSPNL